MINFLDKLLIIQPWVVFISIIILSLLSNTFIGDFLWILWMLLFVYWTIRVGEKLYEQLKDKSILSLKRFKFQIIFVIIYLVV
ncbi:hypothetical protein [Tenacibaculum maritimum]|uniref:hypothetical protein n=1 Tax=Tenacibaculum maritimum TaxID=107401 RepID=UPI0012E5BB21|nr:hypothetical protein [Tenacibaculum maritimum]CAA0190027.1 hypothetical protein TMP445_380001 [Tenacibaculum maritimum]